jgi:hypothetical protein
VTERGCVEDQPQHAGKSELTQTIHTLRLTLRAQPRPGSFAEARAQIFFQPGETLRRCESNSLLLQNIHSFRWQIIEESGEFHFYFGISNFTFAATCATSLSPRPERFMMRS